MLPVVQAAGPQQAGSLQVCRWAAARRDRSARFWKRSIDTGGPVWPRSSTAGQSRPPASSKGSPRGRSRRDPPPMQPGLMTRLRVKPWHFIDGQTIVDVVPIVGRCVGRVDAERLDGINNLQHAFDLGPTGQPQQDVAARPYIGHGCAALTARDSPQNIDARDDCTEVVRHPTHERKDAARRKRQDPPALVENLFLGGVAEAYPVLDALLEPKELDMGEITHDGSPSAEKDCRALTPLVAACVSSYRWCSC